MEYTLKDKIQINKEFLAELEIKSWQEIEHLQSQIANIEMTTESAELVKLLNSLLTSYYIFVGGLENLNDSNKINNFTDKVAPSKELAIVDTKEDTITLDSPELDEPNDFLDEQDKAELADEAVFEPFEYFVDFDEPTGEPLTDDDIYNK